MCERAEAEARLFAATLEQRVAVRTDELATFFDLTLLAGQAADLIDVFEQVLTRIMEVTRSRGLCIHLLNTERTATPSPTAAMVSTRSRWSLPWPGSWG